MYNGFSTSTCMYNTDLDRNVSINRVFVAWPAKTPLPNKEKKQAWP